MFRSVLRSPSRSAVLRVICCGSSGSQIGRKLYHVQVWLVGAVGRKFSLMVRLMILSASSLARWLALESGIGCLANFSAVVV